MLVSWSKKTPKNNTQISEWYWYYDPKNKAPEIIEIWSKRDVSRFDGYWWSNNISVPQVPTKNSGKIEEENIPKKRGRPKGSKNKKR